MGSLISQPAMPSLTLTGPFLLSTPQLFEKDEEVTPKSVKAKLQEVLTQRGRKGTNKHEFVATLEALLEIVREKNLGACSAQAFVCV